MPTIYERLQHYHSLPGIIPFSNKKKRKIYNALKRIYDQKKDNAPVQFVESIEGDKTFTVRLYPDSFQKTMDGVIWKVYKRLQNNLLTEAEAIIVKKEKKANLSPLPEKKKRKRIPVGKRNQPNSQPIFSGKIKTPE